MARGKGRVLRRMLLLIGALVAAVWLWTTLTTGLAPEQRAVAFIFLLAVGLWVTEAVPAFAVGLLIMGYLVYVLGSPWLGDSTLDPSAYLDTWSSPVIWLLMGGFFMASGLTRTGLDRQIFGMALRFAGTRPDRVLLVVMITTALASMFLSNTSTAAIMIGAVLPFVKRAGPDEPFSKALLLAIPIAASLGGMGTIIGSAPNAIAAGAADSFGVGPGFLTWMVYGMPVSLALVLGGWRLLLWRYPPAIGRVEADLAGLDEPSTPHSQERRDRWVVGMLTALTIALWITTPLHGLHVSVISLIPIVGLTVSQVIGAREVRALPWDTLMLVAGGLSLGAAVVDTGLAAVIAEKLEILTQLNSAWLTLVLLGWCTVVLSNFMSNTATVSLMLPVAVAMLPGRELEMCLVLGLSASCALLLPVSTPPNAVAFSTGLLQIRDLRLGGLAAALLGPPLIVSWVMLVTAVL